MIPIGASSSIGRDGQFIARAATISRVEMVGSVAVCAMNCIASMAYFDAIVDNLDGHQVAKLQVVGHMSVDFDASQGWEGQTSRGNDENRLHDLLGYN